MDSSQKKKHGEEEKKGERGGTTIKGQPSTRDGTEGTAVPLSQKKPKLPIERPAAKRPKNGGGDKRGPYWEG